MRYISCKNILETNIPATPLKCQLNAHFGRVFSFYCNRLFIVGGII